MKHQWHDSVLCDSIKCKFSSSEELQTKKNGALGDMRQKPQCLGVGETVLCSEKWDCGFGEASWQPTNVFLLKLFWQKKKNFFLVEFLLGKMYCLKLGKHWSIGRFHIKNYINLDSGFSWQSEGWAPLGSLCVGGREQSPIALPPAGWACALSATCCPHRTAPLILVTCLLH